jgi:hypothetical protein
MSENAEAWRQAHIDIEVVAGKVNTLETGFSELKRDVQVGFSQQASTFSAQLIALGEKIERQGSAYAASRNTSISGVLITACSVAGVMLTIIGAFGYVTIGPMFKFEDDIASQMRKTEDASVRRDDFRDFAKTSEAWSVSLRDRLRSDEDNAVSQRQIAELKDRFDERYKITSEDEREKFARLESQVTAIDGNLVKRPEIEAANHAQDERITTLSTRMNAIQAQIDSFFPPSKIIDELWRGLAELRTGAVTTAK